MAQYNVKLNVDTSQHDRALERSAGQVNMYAKRIMGAKDKVMGLTKKIPALALAIGGLTVAMKTVTTVMKSTDSGADTLQKHLDVLKMSYDRVLKSFASGNFSGLIRGWRDLADATREAYDAVDNYDSHKQISNYAHKAKEAKIAELERRIRDKSLTPEQRKPLQEELDRVKSENDAIYRMDKDKAREAAIKVIKKYGAGKINDVAALSIMQMFEDGMDWSSISKKYIDMFEKGWSTSPDQFDPDKVKEHEDLIKAYEDFGDLAQEQRDEIFKYLDEYQDIKKYQETLNQKIQKSEQYKVDFDGEDGSGKSSEKAVEDIRYIEGSLGDLEKKLDELKKEREIAINNDNLKEAKRLSEQIAIQMALISGKEIELGISTPNTKFNIPSGQTSDAEIYYSEGLEEQQEALKQYENSMNEIANLQEVLSTSFDDIMSNTLNAANALADLGSLLGEAFDCEELTNFFNTLQGGLDVLNSFFSVYQAIAGMIEVVNTQKEASLALTNAQTAASAAATAANVAETSSESGKGIAAAAASGAKLAFPYNLIAIAMGVSAVIAALSMIGKFADGGIIGGATSVGDMTLARVNKGEMILNQREQSRLFNILSGVDSIGASGSINGDVKFRISGGDLIGVLNNQQKKKSRVL